MVDGSYIRPGEHGDHLIRENGVFERHADRWTGQSGSASADGVNWTLVNSSGISMAANAYIGWAVASGSTGVLLTSTLTNVSVAP